MNLSVSKFLGVILPHPIIMVNIKIFRTYEKRGPAMNYMVRPNVAFYNHLDYCI